MTSIEPVGSFYYSVKGYLDLYSKAVLPPTHQHTGWQHDWNGVSGVLPFLQFLSKTDEALQYILAPLLQRLHEIPNSVDKSSGKTQPRWKHFQAELHALAPPETVLRAIIEPRLEFFQGKLKQLNERRRAAQLQSYASDLDDPAMNGPFGPVIVNGHADLEVYRLNAAFPNAFPAEPTYRTYHYDVSDPASFLRAPGRCF